MEAVKMTKELIEKRLGELEMSLKGDETDDDTRADILDEIADLEEKLENFGDDKHQTFIGNCITAFNEDGECVDERLPWSDVTEFAQYVEEFGDNSSTDDLTVSYDAESDVHSFYI